MNQLLRALESLDKDITDDLHSLYELVYHTQGASEAIDNIKIRLSSGITEIKAVIGNRRAMDQEEISIEESNALLRVNKTVAVSVLGQTINPRTTVAKGASCVIWNKNSKLNVILKNPLSNITKHSSEQLAMLALLNQIQVLKIKRVVVVTDTRYLANLCENIELYHAQNFKQGDSENDMPNKHILEQIFALMKETKVQLIFNTDNYSEEERAKLQNLAKIAKDIVKTKLHS